MARLQLYSKTDKRLDKKATHTGYKRKLLFYRIISIISIVGNITLIYFKLLK